jgi:TonB-linked SusC/RagA family outer membrane protein
MKSKYIKSAKAASLALLLAGMPLTALADTQVVGKITNAGTGAVLPGARVSVVDGSATAMTNGEGEYKLTAPDGNVTLRVEAPGFNTIIVPLRGSSTLDIKLFATTSANPMGSDASKTFDVTGSATVSEFSIGEAAADNSVADLQGDLFAVNRSGMPGAGTAVFIEGLHSINSSSQPLYVVDGVVWATSDGFNESIIDGHFSNPLALIDPNDIESISVLRNGTALYGAKGGNGVVYITTKRAHDEATKIEAWASVGFREKISSIPVMDASQYRLYVSDVIGGMSDKASFIDRFDFLNDDPTSLHYKANHNNTDWLGLSTRGGLLMNYGVNVRGGDDRALYGFSLGYTKNDGSVKETSFDRLNIRFNSDINLWAGFKLRFDIAFAQATWHLFDDGINSVSSPTYLSMIKSPLYHPNVISNTGDVTLKYSDVDELNVGNPLSILDLAKADNRNYRFNLAATPQYVFNDAWKVAATVGYTFDKVKENNFIPDYGVEEVPMYNNNGEVYAISRNEVRTLMSRHTVFNLDVHGVYNPLRSYVNNLKFRLGYRFQNDTYNWSYGEGHNVSSDHMNALGQTDANLRFSEGLDTQWRNIAWYLTGDYSLYKRYFLNVAASVESSSLFGKNAPDALRMGGVSWGFFPSVNAAWLISSENFMRSLTAIDMMKLRIGYEKAGNDRIPSLANMTYLASQTLAGHGFGSVIANIGNDKLKWETTGTFRVGLDMNWFANRWMWQFDFYKSKTTDLLMLKNLNEESGLKTFWTNGGELENTGVNFSTTVRVVDTRDFKFDLGAAIGHYKNKVTRLNDGEFTTDIAGAQVLTTVGEPIGVFYGYKTDGVFSTAADAAAADLAIRNNDGSLTRFEAGDMRFVDNGDHIIDAKDRQIIGDPNPDIFGNFNLRLSWKGFTLSSIFTFASGNDVYNALRANLESGSNIYNQSTAMMNRWVANGQETDIPRATYGDPMGNSRFSDRWIEDGSYLKWKSLKLSYDIPIHSPFIQGVEVWFAMNNLKTWTKYLGADPESYAGYTPLYMGIDTGLVPSTREYTFGVKINL